MWRGAGSELFVDKMARGECVDGTPAGETGIHVGADGAEFIGVVLEKNTTITEINLSGHDEGWNGVSPNVGAFGAKHIARALEKNTTITKVDLRSRRWTPCVAD